MNNKTIIEFGVRIMKNYGDLGGCCPPQPTTSTDNTLLDLHSSSQDTQPHSLTVNYFHLGHFLQFRRGAYTLY